LNLISQQVLVPYSLDWPLPLTADASPVGTGCVLAHVTEDGKEEPIAFASKYFSDRDLRYPVQERKAAALIFGLKNSINTCVPENLKLLRTINLLQLFLQPRVKPVP